MVDDDLKETSGTPIYELSSEDTEKTTHSHVMPGKMEDKTSAEGYSANDIAKYGRNKPTRDTVYAKIIRKEQQNLCKISEETKTTE